MDKKQLGMLVMSLAVTAVICAGILSLGSGLIFAGIVPNTIGANEAIPGTCIPIIANQLISFPSTAPGTFAATTNAENVINFGNAASNILVFGTNWVAAPSIGNFLVGNTLWSQISLATNNGNQLTYTAVDTHILMVANGGANVIFFGLNVPTGQGAGTYNQALTIEGSC